MSTPVLHRAAGLIVSADRRLPGFVAAEGTRSHDARVHLEAMPSWHDSPSTLTHAADYRDADGTPVVQVRRSPGGLQFDYADGTRFWIDANANDIWCTWPPSASLDDTCTYLCGPILGMLLRMRGALALHASAVCIGRGAIAFVGPHGAGKSTIAAALGAAGHAVVTDDVLHVRLDGTEWLAEPFASMVKLWPDGAALALGPRADLPPITDGWDKRALHLGDSVPAVTDAVVLAGIACLHDRGSISIEPLKPAAALVQLAANSSAAHLLDSSARAAEFGALSTLVRSVPCAAIAGPEEPAAFPEFISRVLEWARDPSAR